MEEKEQELRDAAGRGDKVRVQQLLAEGVYVNAEDSNKWTALHYAAKNGHAGTVQALLTAGATVDSRNDWELTALHFAAGNGHADTAQALLTAGADVNARSNFNFTPLHEAANDGHAECVKVLLKAGANTAIKEQFGNTAEERAKQEDVLHVFQLFKVSPKYTPLQPKVVSDLLTIDLSGKGLTSVPAEVFDARDIERLDLSNNRLTSIPEEIGQLQKLRELKLDNNLLTQLPQAITTLPNLQNIELSINKLETLPDGFSRLQLHELYLQCNWFKEIPDGVCSLLQLKILNMGSNPLKSLPDKIARLRGLSWLAIDYCRFDEFPRQVLQLEGLKTLHMGNWAGEDKPSPVPEDIGRLKNLQDLQLRDNGLESLPDGVGELVKLKYLGIAGNRFTSVPEQIMKLSNIRKLDLSNNRISRLPLTLSRLAGLENMDISGNPLTYPPPDVCKKGTAAIMDFLRREMKEKEEKELRKLFHLFSQSVTETTEVDALSGALGLTVEEMINIQALRNQTPSSQAHMTLLKWMEKDREASMDKLQLELRDIGMDRLAEEVGRIKAERLKRPADASGGPPAKRQAAGGFSRVGHQEEQQTKEEIRQAEQKLVQMQHHSEIQETMVSSLRAEVTRLTDKEDRAQKVLLDHKQEIQQLQEANVAMATREDSLLQDNEKLRSQVVLLGGEQYADEETTQVLERTILMFTENVLQKSGQSKPDLEETELATSAESALLTKLSCRLGSDWRRLGAALGVPQPRLDSIQQAGYNNAIQRACKVLTVWMCGGDHGLPHDLKQLEAALADMERTDLLDIVRTAYKDYIKEMPEVEVEPEASVDEQGVATWSVQLPGRGKYVCKHTDLGIVTPCAVQLTYRTVNPSEHWPEYEDWELIGPLFHIQCNHDDGVPVELLLPHILDLSQEDGSVLTTDEAKAAQVVAGNTTFHRADVTPTHFVTRHQKGSLWGSVLRKLRALSVSRRGLFALFKTSQTPHGVDIKAHIVSNTKEMVETLQEDLSKLHPRFYPWDSLPCSFRPHQVYCLQASVENGTLAHVEPQPPSGLEYEDTLDCNRIYPSFHMTVQRPNPGPEHLQHLRIMLQLYPQEEDNNVVCSCTRYLDDGVAIERRRSDDVSEHFYFIKENVSVHWKDLAGFLGFRRPDIDTIQYKPANRDAKDCCIDMLEQWRRRRGDAATLQVLLLALTDAGLQDVVDQLNTM